MTAPGATWLDRQLVARDPVPTAGGFGAEIRDAMARRAEHLMGKDLPTATVSAWFSRAA